MKSFFNSQTRRFSLFCLLFLLILSSVSFSSKASESDLTLTETEIMQYLGNKKDGTDDKLKGRCLTWAVKQYSEMAGYYAEMNRAEEEMSGFKFPRNYHGDPGSQSYGCCTPGVEDRNSLSKSDDIPIGALVFFEGPNNQRDTCSKCGRKPGHTGIYVGNGEIISLRGSGQITVDKISLWDKNYGYPYKGWLLPKNVDIIRDITAEAPKISDPHIENVTADGFDVVVTLSNPNGTLLAYGNCIVGFKCDTDHISWWKYKPNGIRNFYAVQDIVFPDNFGPESAKDRCPQYTGDIKNGKIRFHYKLEDEYGEKYIENNYNEPDGLLPRVGMEGEPYVEAVWVNTCTAFLWNYSSGGSGSPLSLDLTKEPIYVDLNSYIENPKEGEETTESDNGGNAPEETPNGDSNANLDTSNSASHYFGEPEVGRVKAPGEFVDNGSYSYKVVGDREVYLSIVKKKKSKVYVGGTIEENGVTYKVTGISKETFEGDKKIKEVTIGEGVTAIGRDAFRNCKKLKLIKIKSKDLKLTYKSSFKGTHKDMKVWVRYKDKLKKYRKLIAKAGVSAKTTYSFRKF